jgi:outer membrane immunogenic protein
MTNRKNLFRSFLLATTILCASSVANADGLNKKHHPIFHIQPASDQDAFSWSGFYVGIGGGQGLLRADANVNSAVTQSKSRGGYFGTEGYTQGSSLDKKMKAFGAFATIEGGVNYVNDQVLMGAFASWDIGRISVDASTADSATLSSDNLASYNASASLNHELTLNGRVDLGAKLGYLVTDRTLVYALGGLSLAEVEASSSLTVDHDPASALADFDLSTRAKDWKKGYVLGLGAEFALTGNTTIKTEYRFADYGTISSSDSSDAGGDGSASIGQEDDIQVHSLRAVLSYHF